MNSSVSQLPDLQKKRRSWVDKKLNFRLTKFTTVFIQSAIEVGQKFLTLP